MKDLIRGAAISVAAAAAFFALFAAAALFAPQDQVTIRHHIVEALADGSFNAQVRYGPFDGVPIPRHVFNCLPANMMLAPPAGRLADALSNRYAAQNPAWHDPRVPDWMDCQALLRAASAPESVQFLQYDRYILGLRVLGRVLLSAMSLDATAQLLRGTAYALLAAIGVAALLRWRGAHDEPDRSRTLAFAIIAPGLALLYGVHYFDATLYLGPLDCTHFAFILIALFLPLAQMRPAGLALYAASYGSLVAIFEFLTGGVPFALAMLPLLLAAGFRADGRDYARRLILLWGCFCVAVVTSFAIKKGIAVAFLGDTDSFLTALSNRMYGDLPPADVATRGDLSLKFFYLSYRRWSGLIALGSRNIGSGLVIVALATFVIATWRGWTARVSSPLLWACWLSLAVLIVWFAVFFNHAILHPFLMVRLFVVPVIAAAVLIATAKRPPRVNAG